MLSPSDELPHPHGPITVQGTLEVGQTVVLPSTAVAALVFRQINPKEACTLRDATGTYFRASVKALDPAGGEAVVYEQLRDSTESPARITLACAVLQRQRMLTVSQKATELGVMNIQPLFTTRSVQADGLSHEKHHAWPGQVLKGARQCRRASIPMIALPERLDRFVTGPRWKTARMRLFLDDRSETLPHPTAGASRSVQSIVLVVGPEGGFADHERQLLLDAGALPLRLGGRVLRAETAVFAGIAAVQIAWGDMSF